MKNKICLSKSAFFGIMLAVLAIYTVFTNYSGFVDGVIDALTVK